MTKKWEETLKKMYIDWIQKNLSFELELDEEEKLKNNFSFDSYFNLINDYDGHESDEDAEDYLVQYVELKENLELDNLEYAAALVADAKDVSIYENFWSEEIEEFYNADSRYKHFDNEVTKELRKKIWSYSDNKKIEKIIVDFLELDEEEAEDVKWYFDDANLSINELLNLAIKIFSELNISYGLLLFFKESLKYHSYDIYKWNEILDYWYNVL